MITLLVTLGILAIILFWMITVYNKLVKSKTLSQEAWSGIDVFLKKRYDLIPNLVETVKGYAAHEKETLAEVVRYRSSAMESKDMAEQIENEQGLGRALGRLMAITESYPDLKANIHFMDLQRQLSALEGDLSLARRYYNGAVRENNILIESFPSNFIANMFNFAKGVFFEIDKAEKVAPKVSF
ncbi:MAG: LemA family protein [Tannerella sp.]|jgi:LemA protein|nr:LemA family protein [Tannerella sp.]